MTDLERVRFILTPLFTLVSEYDETNSICMLDDLRAKNQNRPPLGEADGSLNVAQWEALRDVVVYLQGLKSNLKLLGKLTDGSNP